MYYIGAHVSISGGVFNAPLRAKELEASGFAMFVKNQRQWVSKTYTAEDIAEFKNSMDACGFKADQVLPHAGYLINMANPDEEAHAKSMDSLMDELTRCELLGLSMLNIHPGSHLRKISVEQACDRIAMTINTALSKSSGVKIVLENTAGTGGNLGSRFEEIQSIINGVEDKSRIGVCIDTMHSFAAGFDLRDLKGFQRTIDLFDKSVGLKYLCGMHLNDSKVELNAHRDRHASLGRGFLGMDVFEFILQDKHFENIPLVLETPDDSIWKEEIARLKQFAS